MDIRNRRAIVDTASQKLSAAPGSPQQVVLVYAGIGCLLSLLSSLLSLVLDQQIAGTGGLSGMGLRSVLSTVQTVLPIVQTLVMLCLGYGYHSAALRMSRGVATKPATLLEGFRHIGVLLRTTVLQYLIYIGLAIGSLYASIYIFLLLPFSDGFYDLMEPLTNSSSLLNSAATLDDATMVAASQELTPVLWIFLLLFLAVFLPIYYLHRMVMFSLADEPQLGAFRTLRRSCQMMRRNRLALLKLDLRFWWYYLLQIVVTIVCYGDLLLPMLGVTLPFSGTVSYFLFYGLSLALQFALYYFFMNRVTVAYAIVYEELRPKPQNHSVALGNIFQM